MQREKVTEKFCNDEIELAQLFKAFGLDWEPCCGQYVLDQSELIEVGSPFQNRVYFILDLKHFLRRAETIDELKRRMCWLPDWQDARQILRQMGVPSQQVANHLFETRAIERDIERLELYRLIEAYLVGAIAL